MNQGALHFNALLTTQDFKKGIRDIVNEIKGISTVAQQETSKMDGYFKNLGLSIGGYFSAQALKGFVMELINVRGEFQKTEIAFTTMLGNGDKAKVLMGEMVDLATKTPFSLQDVSAGAKQLLAFQVPANEVVDTLTRMGNIAAGLGVPLSRINLVYGQVKAKGRLMGDDLRQFTEAGIPMVAELAKKFNKTTAEISDMVSAGKIGFKDVQDVLFSLTNEGGMFFNLMEKQSASLSGKIANLGDAWDQMLNQVGEANEGILYDSIEALSYLVENYQTLLNIIEGLIVTYGSYKAAVIVTSSAQAFANKTIQSEIALLSISEKMKLGRAMVTQRQAEATAREAAAEVVSTQQKYKALQAEVAMLSAKRQTLRQSGLSSLAKMQEAKLQLSLAQSELASIQTVGTAREIEIAQKRVVSAQNAVISAQDTATIAKNAAVANSITFRTKKQALENTARAIGTAQGASVVASEAAQTAAKNVNAIATTRLTIATRFRTAATQLATQAQVLLNATMLNNPIVLAIAAVAGLTYAYFKLRDTTTSLSIAEKLLNEERKRSSKQIEDIKNKTQELTSIINSDTTTKLQQLEAYKQMQALYPSLLKDMDVETFKKLDSTDAQKKLNTEIDKFSTQNLRNQVTKSNEKIQGLINKIKELEERLKKRSGDSGIDLNELESAKKNLEAQKINLQKYNTELKERLQNEKLSSMNLEQQKRYWQEQEISIKKQISAQEASNAKKAEALDKLNNINSLVKSTSAGFFKWNLSPLLGQLEKVQEEINKINNNQKGVSVDKNKAYWEAQKKAAEEANDAMSGKDIGSSAWNENIKKIREATEQLKKYDYTDKEFLKAQKARDKERKLLEKGAEKAYLEGSVKRYDQQISLLEEALARSAGDNVQTRYIDKYGKERFSDEIQTIKQVTDQIIALREKKAEREREIEIKSFDDQLSELQRRISIRDKLLENGYSKESVGEMFPDLVGKDLIQSLQTIQAELNKTIFSGKGTKADGENFTKITDVINGLINKKTELEKFNKSLDDLKLNFSSFDYYDELEKLLSSQPLNTELDAEKRKELQNRYDQEKQTREESYQQFLKDQVSFEEQSVLIQKKYDLIRKNILSDTRLTPSQRTNALAKAGEMQAEEFSNAFVNKLVNDPKYRQAFINLESQTIGAIKKLRAKLLLELQSLVFSGKATPEAIAKIREDIERLNGVISAKNPFERIGELLDIITKKAQTTKERLTAIVEIGGLMQGISTQLTGAVNDVEGIMGDIGVSLDSGFGDVLDKIKGVLQGIGQMGEGLSSMATGALNGNPIQVITGGIKAIGGLVKSVGSLFNNDRKKERNIKRWAEEVENLKNQYQALQRAVEKALGEDTYKQQQAQVANLRAQQAKLQQMIREERGKKKTDNGKISEWQNQINDINGQIEDIYDNIAQQISGTNAKDLASQLADALIEAYGKGEDAATAFGKVADDVMKNAVKNALKMQLLEKPMENIIKQLIKNMGFKDDGTGTFDGLTEDERAQIKAMMASASQNYMDALKAYEDLFGAAALDASSLEGAVKGVSEETASLIAGQMNGIRINQGIGQEISNQSLAVFREQLLVQYQIENNTRNLLQIRKDIGEMNSKMKEGGLRASGLI